jgi:hypothetical protein
MPDMPTETQRDARLWLRGPREFARPRLSWPLDAPYGRPMAVFLADIESSFAAADALCHDAGFVVLALRTEDPEVATIAVEWAGDHAEQLGADGRRLVVAGGRLAAAAAVRARDEGWPPLDRQVLIGPDLDCDADLHGLAPATVVNAPAYAKRLRAAGVPVQELSDDPPMSFSWVAGLRNQDVDHEESQDDHRSD